MLNYVHFSPKYLDADETSFAISNTDTHTATKNYDNKNIIHNSCREMSLCYTPSARARQSRLAGIYTKRKYVFHCTLIIPSCSFTPLQQNI